MLISPLFIRILLFFYIIERSHKSDIKTQCPAIMSQNNHELVSGGSQPPSSHPQNQLPISMPSHDTNRHPEQNQSRRHNEAKHAHDEQYTLAKADKSSARASQK